MIRKFDHNDRRILTFPAVHPCEGISPATLLDSLITLSHNICNYQSKFFATQKRNSRESIRQIGILRLFFEEIRQRKLISSDSVVLCFSELHLAFQKIQFLLEDCTREGSKIWILMKSQFVTTQFRVLIRSLATALDVLPLNSIDLSLEIKELVELVTKQARKAKLELHPDDETAMNRVIFILNRFEKGFEPEQSMIKKVLDYLEIRSWGDCNKEIKFLDEEIGLEYLDCDEREVPLLSSIVGFMSYSRGIVFESSVFGNSDQTESKPNLEILRCLNLDDFRCPISLELMTDPVTVSTGQTYDRDSIQKWLKSGNFNCPKTGEKLKNTELVPNSALRKLINQFCAENRISMSKWRKKNQDITRTIISESPASAEAMKYLAEFLAERLCNGTEEQKNKAAYEIRLLAKSSISNRSFLIETGSVPPLLILLTSTDQAIQENAIAALLKLSKHAKGKKEIIDNEGLTLILMVLKKGVKLEIRQIAAATVFYLSSVPEYRRLIGENPEAIPALVELIKDGNSCGKKNAVVALFGLLLHRANHWRVLASGTVPLLINLLNFAGKTDVKADSLAVLATLAETTDGSNAIIQATDLDLIVSNLQSLNSRAGKEYCVSILLSLCNNCGIDVITVLANHSLLGTLLYPLLTDGTSHASKKARALLKILHKFHETSSSGLMTNEVRQEQFIHSTDFEEPCQKVAKRRSLVVFNKPPKSGDDDVAAAASPMESRKFRELEEFKALPNHQPCPISETRNPKSNLTYDQYTK